MQHKGANMLRVCIVDNRPDDREQLASSIRLLLDEHEHNLACAQFDTAESFLAGYERCLYDLVFLGIDLNGMGGIDLAHKLRTQDSELLIVFVADTTERIFDTFHVHPFDYLVRPYQHDKLLNVLDEARRTIRSSERSLELHWQGDVKQVPLRHICSVQFSGRAADLRLCDKSVLHGNTAHADARQSLEHEPRFLPCGRDTIVNMDHIVSADEGVLVTKDGQSHALPSRDQASLLKRFTQFTIARME